MGRPSNTTARRAQIIDGLLTVMAARGYEAASVVAVAQAAGLSPGLVHYHFENKQEILLALVDMIGRRVKERRVHLSARARSVRARLFAAVDAFLAEGDGADPRAVACWVAIGSEAVRQAEVRVQYERLVDEAIDDLERLLRDVLREEGRSTLKARTLAAGLMAAIEGFFRLAAGAPGTVLPGSGAALARAMAIGLIEAQTVRQ